MRRLVLSIVLFAACGLALAQVQIRIRSDFEAGSRAYQAGDIKMAVTFFRQGAEKGDPQSEFALGTHYAFGEGVPESFPEAIRLLQSSAGKGYPPALTFLGVMHQRGMGFPVDDRKAVEHFRKASMLCDSQARNLLANALYEGKGTSPNRPESHAWMRLAAEAGEVEAKKYIGIIWEQLVTPERDKAAEYYAEYKKITCPGAK
jgi:hypothetical protein